MLTSTARRQDALPEPPVKRSTLLERIANTPASFRYGSLIGLGSFLLLMHFTVGNRWEQFLACGIFLTACFWSNASRRFAMLVLPLLLYGIAYEFTHFTSPYVRYLTIHVTEPYNFDLQYFGIPTPDGRIIPSEFFATHNWPIVDFFTGLSYILYLWLQIAFGVYLAATARSPEEITFARRFGWTLLCLNLAAFATYYIYPAAPPWYVADHGFGPVNFDVRASAAGAARWDELTGLNYFASFYGRSADVFGAIPSLHVAGPLLVALYAQQLRKLWLTVFAYGFTILVAFAAVYLQHHYVLDVLLGSMYAVVAWGLQKAVSAAWRQLPRADRSAAASPSD